MAALARLFQVCAVLVALVWAVAPAAAIEIQRVAASGGLEAWLVEDHTNPIIAVRFVFRGAAALDPAGKEGLARMVSATLDEGAGELDSQAFQGRLEELSISLGFDAGRDTFGGTLKTLTENRAVAFELLRLALTEPRFDTEPVDRIRSQILAGLRRDSEDPETVASRALMKLLFPRHPYGRPVRGTPDSIGAITAGDLRGFVARRLARDTLAIGVVGDITAGELSGLIAATFAGLPEKAGPWRLDDTVPEATGQIVVIRKPVPQSAIMFGQVGVKRDDPDFYVVSVLNHVLGGGGFTSRLYDEVREKRGLAYSVYSGLYPLDHAALILGGAGTANPQVGETLKVVREVWGRLARDGIGATELADAKAYMTGSFPLRFTSSDRIASILVGMQLENLGIDYLERRNGYIEAVTPEIVNRVARRLLDAESLAVVVVGEPEGVDARP